jgi:anti-sigma factor RsiW
VTTTDDDMLLLNAYIDGELDPAHALEFERRLAENAALAAERNRIEALRGVLRERLPRPVASQALRRRVAALAEPRRRVWSGAFSRGVFSGGRLSGALAWPAGWAAVVALAFAGGSLATLLALGSASRDPLPERLVASHMRALMASQPVDVASSDRHTVKPWFNGRLPESPRVVNLAPQGFPLAGGRIDVIGLTPAPTLVYHARRHVISVTALPASDGMAAAPPPINGYNIVAWTDGPVAYWAVSDLAAPELQTFVKDFRAGDAEP